MFNLPNEKNSKSFDFELYRNFLTIRDHKWLQSHGITKDNLWNYMLFLVKQSFWTAKLVVRLNPSKVRTKAEAKKFHEYFGQFGYQDGNVVLVRKDF